MIAAVAAVFAVVFAAAVAATLRGQPRARRKQRPGLRIGPDAPGLPVPPAQWEEHDAPAQAIVVWHDGSLSALALLHNTVMRLRVSCGPDVCTRRYDPARPHVPSCDEACAPLPPAAVHVVLVTSADARPPAGIAPGGRYALVRGRACGTGDVLGSLRAGLGGAREVVEAVDVGASDEDADGRLAVFCGRVRDIASPPEISLPWMRVSLSHVK